ncbi:hypothetical protein [Nostoc sp.]|uniref:hypothetical protein n=1 Tax=Nostoc sp. TaxID=1180 RepID=UPI002FF838BC
MENSHPSNCICARLGEVDGVKSLIMEAMPAAGYAYADDQGRVAHFVAMSMTGFSTRRCANVYAIPVLQFFTTVPKSYNIIRTKNSRVVATGAN